MTILLATHNAHKSTELTAILGQADGLRILSLNDLSVALNQPVEDGVTIEANAYIKAHEIFLATGIPTIADDTGLEVQVLDGAPGIYSARYAGQNASYEDNCRKLLDALANVSEPERLARFRTVICYCDGLRTLFAEGSIDGEILTEARGTAGFGYDPIFRPAGGNRSFAEMDPEEKNAISHRSLALRQLTSMLAPYIADEVGSIDG